MRISHWLLLSPLFLLPRFAVAETFDLVCVHREYRMALSFTLDSVRNTIIHNGVLARDVYIDKTTISFTVAQTSGEYFHFISRASGNMTVRAPHGILIHGYECTGVRAQF
jgi:hypothetical protein